MIGMVTRSLERGRGTMRQAFRAVLRGLRADTQVQLANAEGLAGESLPNMELFQQFGFTSAPPEGTELIVLPLGGRTSASVIVGTENGAFRLVVGKGECALYNQWGDKVHLKADRSILLQAAAKVTVAAPLAEFAGDVTVAGTLTAATDVIGGGKSMTGHRHPVIAVGTPTGVAT